MNQTIHEGYFGWLFNQVIEAPERSTHSHWALLSQLHEKPFRWYIEQDDNRNSDGQDLRAQFLDTFSIYEPDEPWNEVEASVFEVLIALSRRVAYISYGSPEAWFWKFLDNLRLSGYVDTIHHRHIAAVDAVLERWLERNYKFNGEGGLFPLRDAQQDQRRIEIWYQANAYVLEGNDAAPGPPLT